FGRMIGRPRDGWVLYGVMVVLFLAGLALCGWAEQAGNPRLGQAGNVARRVTDGQPGGNMEGKETRFGIGGSVLTAITTSNGATGSYNAMHDSFTPLGGMIPLGNMLLGEVIFGGLGTGLVSMILVALIGVFVGGMMVGRPPEYLGKQTGPLGGRGKADRPTRDEADQPVCAPRTGDHPAAHCSCRGDSLGACRTDHQ